VGAAAAGAVVEATIRTDRPPVYITNFPPRNRVQ